MRSYLEEDVEDRRDRHRRSPPDAGDHYRTNTLTLLVMRLIVWIGCALWAVAAVKVDALVPSMRDILLGYVMARAVDLALTRLQDLLTFYHPQQRRRREELT